MTFLGFHHPDDEPSIWEGVHPGVQARAEAGCSLARGCRCGYDCVDQPDPEGWGVGLDEPALVIAGFNDSDLEPPF